MKTAALAMAAVILGFVSSPVAQAQSAIIQKILVKVNGEIFTLTELEQRQIQAIRELNQQVDPQKLQDPETLQKLVADVTPEILVEVVDELLLVQRGKELGFRMADSQFQQILERVKKENNLDDAGLKAALGQEGLTMPEYRQMMERQYIIQGVQQKEIMGQVMLTEAEGRMYYQAHQELFLKPAVLTLREVFVSVPSETRAGQMVINVAADEAARDKMQAARDRILKGENMATVVADVSESGSKTNEGLVSINLSDIDPRLRQVLEPLSPGQVTEPIRTARGYQIFRLEARTPAEVEPFDKVRDQIGQRIYNDRLDAETDKFLDRMRTQAVIEWKDETYRKLYEQGRQKAGG